MSIQELLTGGGGLVVLALTVIQVAPVKINPWSAIAKAIGRAINAEVLAELERTGKLSAVVTQNIDGLHQMAGSQRVFELHGSVHRNICQACGAVYSAEWICARDHEDAAGVPVCPVCGGRIKPDVVLYEEPLDERVLTGAVAAIAAADALIVGGTSLVVYPAAGLTRYFTGDTLAICNLAPTDQDTNADLLISCDIAAAFAF